MQPSQLKPANNLDDAEIDTSVIEDVRATGPGAVEDIVVGPEPMLNGASEYEYVEIFNPLPVDFIGKFGITKPANIPMQIRSSKETSQISQTEEDVRRNYGLNLKNPDHKGIVHVVNKVKIPSGKSVRLLGNEAQVIVNQLVTVILQREGKALLLADPNARNQIERRVIKSRGYLQDILGRAPVTVSEQLHDAVNTMEDNNEKAFPDLNGSQPEVPASPGVNEPADSSGAFPGANGGDSQTPSDNPAPGTGATFEPSVGKPGTRESKQPTTK